MNPVYTYKIIFLTINEIDIIPGRNLHYIYYFSKVYRILLNYVSKNFAKKQKIKMSKKIYANVCVAIIKLVILDLSFFSVCKSNLFVFSMKEKD